MIVHLHQQNLIPILVRIASLLVRIKEGRFVAQLEEESERHRLHAEGPLQEASDDSVSEVDDQEDLELAISQMVPAEERRQTEAVSVLGVPVCEQCKSSHIGVAKGLS